MTTQDHESRVTGLALLKGNLLASCSFDRSLRVWDLTTMKPLAVVPSAHDTPIQCLEYCAVRAWLVCCSVCLFVLGWVGCHRAPQWPLQCVGGALRMGVYWEVARAGSGSGLLGSWRIKRVGCLHGGLDGGG